MSEIVSFGAWVQSRRNQLRFNRRQFADLVGCAPVTIKKIERDERRPSLEMAQLLATHLQIPEAEQEDFLRRARGEFVPTLADPTELSLAEAQAPPAPEDTPQHNLPHPTTPFFGRAQELADIAARLADPDCRLLTILAPGGMGKSRLAIAAAQAQLDQFTDGVIWVPLAPVAAPEAGTALNPLVGVIADALDIPFHGRATPEQQLFSYLRALELLLVLDNFEHLLPVVTFVGDLLSQAPDVKILVTSRERLHLQEEWLLPLSGLDLPPSGSLDKALTGAAVQLFTQRARQVRSSFNLAGELEAVLRICQLVEGMPLGLELAAAWLFQLSCDEIAAEIAAEIDFLATKMHNVPDRHRSIRSVFGYSWERLSPTERDVLQKLSIFRGGFDRAAAKAVASATLPVLASLTDKSLVTLAEDGRYIIHELLRQFAAERLAATSPIEQETVAAHAHYFLTFLRDQQPKLHGVDGPAAVTAMNREMDNIRIAIQTAVEDNLDLFTRPVAHSLGVIDASLVEMEAALNLIVARLKQACTQQKMPGNEEAQTERMRVAYFLTTLSWKQIFLQHLQEAEESVNDALGWIAAIPGHKTRAVKAECLGLMALIQFWRGHYIAGLDSALASAAIRLELDDTSGYGGSQRMCELISLQIGDFGAAKQYLDAALNAWGENRLAASHYWHERAKLATIEGNLIEADALLQRSVAELTNVGDTEALAWVWREWGNVARLRGRYAEAKTYGRRSIALAEKWHNINARILCDWFFGNVAVDEGYFELALRHFDEYARRGQLRQEQLGGPGWAHLGLGDDARARQCFANTLQHTVQNQARPIGLDALVGMAHLKARAGQPEEALVLLALVRSHPSSHYDSREKARQLWDELAAELPADLVARAEARGRELDLEKTATAILAEAN